MNHKIQVRNNMIKLASFLFNLEAEKGFDFMFGGVKVGEAINSFCALSWERPIWEEIVWPQKGKLPRPEKGKII